MDYDPVKYKVDCKERFSKMSNEGLIEAFNKQVGNSGVTNSRMVYLHALREQLELRSFDCTAIQSEQDGISYAKEVFLDEGNVIKIKD